MSQLPTKNKMPEIIKIADFTGEVLNISTLKIRKGISACIKPQDYQTLYLELSQSTFRNRVMIAVLLRKQNTLSNELRITFVSLVEANEVLEELLLVIVRACATSMAKP